jgi:large subunit ribosomal protein L29
MAKKQDTNKVKTEDLRGKSPDELNAMLLTLRQEQMNLRFQKAGGQLENTSQMRRVRRTIAKVKTILGQQAQGGALATAKPAKTKKAAKAA